MQKWVVLLLLVGVACNGASPVDTVRRTGKQLKNIVKEAVEDAAETGGKMTDLVKEAYRDAAEKGKQIKTLLKEAMEGEEEVVQPPPKKKTRKPTKPSKPDRTERKEKKKKKKTKEKTEKKTPKSRAKETSAKKKVPVKERPHTAHTSTPKEDTPSTSTSTSTPPETQPKAEQAEQTIKESVPPAEDIPTPTPTHTPSPLDTDANNVTQPEACNSTAPPNVSEILAATLGLFEGVSVSLYASDDGVTPSLRAQRTRARSLITFLLMLVLVIIRQTAKGIAHSSHDQKAIHATTPDEDAAMARDLAREEDQARNLKALIFGNKDMDTSHITVATPDPTTLRGALKGTRARWIALHGEDAADVRYIGSSPLSPTPDTLPNTSFGTSTTPSSGKMTTEALEKIERKRVDALQAELDTIKREYFSTKLEMKRAQDSVEERKSSRHGAEEKLRLQKSELNETLAEKRKIETEALHKKSKTKENELKLEGYQNAVKTGQCGVDAKKEELAALRKQKAILLDQDLRIQAEAEHAGKRISAIEEERKALVQRAALLPCSITNKKAERKKLVTSLQDLRTALKAESSQKDRMNVVFSKKELDAM